MSKKLLGNRTLMIVAILGLAVMIASIAPFGGIVKANSENSQEDINEPNNVDYVESSLEEYEIEIPFDARFWKNVSEEDRHEVTPSAVDNSESLELPPIEISFDERFWENASEEDRHEVTPSAVDNSGPIELPPIKF